MKKVLFISLLMVFIVSLCAEIFPVKTDFLTPDYSMKAVPQQRTASREVPEWEWSVPPQDLLTNYADYFQCYNQTPIALQSEENGGGVYMIYRVKDAAGNSEISYTYVDNMGVVQASQGIGSVGYYPDAIVHQETGDVFGTWHVALDDGTGTYDCLLIYDLYHIIQGHGLWKDPVITVLDSDAQNGLDPTADDEFIWPQLAIGPSPEAGKQRIYCVASNHMENDGSTTYPSENVMIMYADFNADDLNAQSNLEWSYNTIPTLDSWNAADPTWYRPFKSFCVIDNQLIFMGYKIADSDVSTEPDELFCMINDNYGEGDNWQEYYSVSTFPEENPLFTYIPTGREWYLYSDRTNIEDPTADPTDPWPVEQQIIYTGHFNIVPTHDNSAVTWAGNMGVTFDSGDGPGYYWVTGYQIYPKTFTFDLNTHEFNITDVYPSGDYPNDGILMEPWDLNEDDVLDSVQANGFPNWEEDWPIFHYDAESAFHYNENYLTTNNENGWMAYLWVDGLYANAANEGFEGYEDWVAKPELAVCVSNDWGATWSDPIFMNANENSDTYVEEFAGMIPCFAYPGDRIEDDGDGYGIVHLFFLDDNDYGSNHSQTHGLNNGSTFEYAAMRIYFGEGGGHDADDTELVSVPLQIKNYPNPFNPTTTIQFETQTAGHVTIDIYNVKGQKIRTLVDDTYEAGIHPVTWNGTNANGSEVPSGVYFYKTKFGKYTTSKKMILMK
ncbi:MAG: T9SS type A sorting domain-containing protein [Candidatus Cloacimonetes bacterium]|nr:T9SS type A sorting domain-containing protein [Candidatus Cloacimonadota bacterium]